MGQWRHEEALRLALKRPVTGKVIAARLHVRHCQQCTRAIESLLTAIDTVGEKPPWEQDRLGGIWLNLARAFSPGDQLLLATKAREEKIPVESEEMVYQFSLGTEETGNLDIEITAYRDEQAPERCTIFVKAEIPSRWPQLAGTEVVMEKGADAFSEKTDEEGVARFEKIPVAELPEVTFRVIPPISD